MALLALAVLVAISRKGISPESAAEKLQWISMNSLMNNPFKSLQSFWIHRKQKELLGQSFHVNSSV
jgi:hypothetical protein